jgi:hypothetical protein
MFRTLRPLVALAVLASATQAAAQDAAPEAAPSEPGSPDASAAPAPAATGTNTSSGDEPGNSDDESAESPSKQPEPTPVPDAAETAAVEALPSAQERKKFEISVSGYFRAPMTLGISNRPGPQDKDGPSRLQISHGPTRTVDANYYSFAYTRLQEQDWAEVFFHAKKEHVEAVVGWMGYWFQAAGFRNYDAGWAPGLAYLTLDTDVELGSLRPNVALSMGSFWPAFGYFEKYDTYTLGRFRQLGEQLQLTVPLGSDLKVTFTQGFGTNRDGSFNLLSPAPYQATVGLDLLHYEHLKVAFGETVDVGVHFNHQWTRDPNLTQRGAEGQSYPDAREAKFTTMGGELNVRLPRAGHLWLSPSFTRIRNGWALAQGGTEVMHSLGGAGFASNYMAWDEFPGNSTGTGSTFNLGFLYENSLSNILGKRAEDTMPEVTASVFGLLINSKLSLPETSVLPQDEIKQMKYGADVTVQPLTWLGVMLRWDEANYDLDNDGRVFSAITTRLTFSSHFLSSESIYLQYSRYRYGDRMTIAEKWPWGQDMIPGNHIVQGGQYAGDRPDMDVVKVQANVTF